jgi:hypothetical protein
MPKTPGSELTPEAEAELLVNPVVSEGYVTRAARDEAEWDMEVGNALEVEGYSLYGGKENDRTLDALVDVAFVTKHVTFRQGDIVPQGAASARDYVSVELLVNPEDSKRFPRKYVVLNDGSTGIYRQIVAALAMDGQVTLDDEMPGSGDANTTRYDVSFSGPKTDKHGLREGREFDIRIYCPEGLRKSDYPNEFGGGNATTWYLG